MASGNRSLNVYGPPPNSRLCQRGEATATQELVPAPAS